MVFPFSVALALVLLAALVATFLSSALAPKLTLVIYTVVGFTSSLALLWLYLTYFHDPSNWWFFGSDSIVPHALAAAAFIAVIVIALARASGALIAKLLVGVLTLALWGIAWFDLTLFVACVKHNCF